MKNEPLISVIIPAFNASAHLPSCVDSIFRSSYGNYEIIFVEDCSQDGTWGMLQEYRQQYDEIRLIRNQENLGPGRSRNIGLETAKGTYILFVDADDLIHPELMSITVQYAEQLKLDLVYYGAELFHENEPISLAVDFQTESLVCTGKELFTKQEQGTSVFHAPWCKLYRRGFLMENRLEFYPGLWYEDLLFHFQCLMQAQRVVELKDKLYFYRKHETSITAVFDDREPESFFVTLSEIYKRWLVNDFTDAENEAVGRFFKHIWNMYQTACFRCERELPWREVSNDYATNFLYKLLNGLLPPSYSAISKPDCDKLRNGGRVYVYGARNRAAEIYRQLQAEKIAVTAFIVSSMQGNVAQFARLPVLVLGETRFHADDKVVIAVSPDASHELEEQLRSQGTMNIIWPVQATHGRNS